MDYTYTFCSYTLGTYSLEALPSRSLFVQTGVYWVTWVLAWNFCGCETIPSLLLSIFSSTQSIVLFVSVRGMCIGWERMFFHWGYPLNTSLLFIVIGNGEGTYPCLWDTSIRILERNVYKNTWICPLARQLLRGTYISHPEHQYQRRKSPYVLHWTMFELGLCTESSGIKKKIKENGVLSAPAKKPPLPQMI